MERKATSPLASPLAYASRSLSSVRSRKIGMSRKLTSPSSPEQPSGANDSELRARSVEFRPFLSESGMASQRTPVVEYPVRPIVGHQEPAEGVERGGGGGGSYLSLRSDSSVGIARSKDRGAKNASDLEPKERPSSALTVPAGFSSPARQAPSKGEEPLQYVSEGQLDLGVSGGVASDVSMDSEVEEAYVVAAAAAAEAASVTTPEGSNRALQESTDREEDEEGEEEGQQDNTDDEEDEESVSVFRAPVYEFLKGVHKAHDRFINAKKVELRRAGFPHVLRARAMHITNTVQLLRLKMESRLQEVDAILSRQERKLQAFKKAFVKATRKELDEIVAAGWSRAGHLGFIDIGVFMEPFVESQAKYPQGLLHPIIPRALLPETVQKPKLKHLREKKGKKGVAVEGQHETGLSDTLHVLNPPRVPRFRGLRMEMPCCFFSHVGKQWVCGRPRHALRLQGSSSSGSLGASSQLAKSGRALPGPLRKKSTSSTESSTSSTFTLNSESSGTLASSCETLGEENTRKGTVVERPSVAVSKIVSQLRSVVPTQQILRQQNVFAYVRVRSTGCHVEGDTVVPGSFVPAAENGREFGGDDVRKSGLLPRSSLNWLHSSVSSKSSESTTTLDTEDARAVEKVVETIHTPRVCGCRLSPNVARVLRLRVESTDVYRRKIRKRLRAYYYRAKQYRKSCVGILPGGLSTVRLGLPPEPSYPPGGLQSSSESFLSSGSSEETLLSDLLAEIGGESESDEEDYAALFEGGNTEWSLKPGFGSGTGRQYTGQYNPSLEMASTSGLVNPKRRRPPQQIFSTTFDTGATAGAPCRVPQFMVQLQKTAYVSGTQARNGFLRASHQGDNRGLLSGPITRENVTLDIVAQDKEEMEILLESGEADGSSRYPPKDAHGFWPAEVTEYWQLAEDNQSYIWIFRGRLVTPYDRPAAARR